MSETKRLQLYLTEKLKKDLGEISKELGMTQNVLWELVIQSIVTNYKKRNGDICGINRYKK